MKIDSISPGTWAASTGTTTSIRWSRLRGIRSALPSRYVFVVAGLEAVEAAVLEEAAEDRAHADRSLSPGTPGRSVQIARTMRSISAPACEAW